MSKRLPKPFPYLAADQTECRILVVDDHPVNRTLLVRLLERSGFIVNQTTNGSDAFILWQEWQPQLILMDLLMPGMGGREATRLIRATERIARQPPTTIIAITAQTMPIFSHHAHAVGFDDIITKPIQPDSIFECIGHYLKLQYVENSAQALNAQALDINFS
ncbi:response regulator [Leptothoe sp. PORK10 BA2]|uniref:response regulator n=1 Tax=Leptothoe sp. PORK10 BA2 TaxID=3110254 RepID=UPI002B1F8649|nr:response regulator [Leptothoe sp. PORK10 BA2]MEA5462613.1 response regulator [Leptothoe sp. PORK10 BA2]